MIHEPDSQEKEKNLTKNLANMNTEILNEISIFKSSHMQRKNIVGEIFIIGMQGWLNA